MKNLKKTLSKNIFIILVVCIGLLYLTPLFKTGIYSNHDSESIIVKTGALYKAVLDGHIPPRWAGDLNYEYGAPILNFYYPLGNYLGSLLFHVGIPLEIGYKILIGGAFILAGVFFYIFALQNFRKSVAFAGGIIYMLAPYHILDMYVRGHLGEMLALMLAPLILYFIQRQFKKPSLKLIIGTSFLYFLLIISHNILALLFSVVFVPFIVISEWKVKKILLTLLPFAGGILLASYFWIPAILESKYINSSLFVGEFYKDHFIKITNIIYAPWGYGSNINMPGGLAPYLGPLHLVTLLGAIALMKLSKRRLLIIFWSVVVVLSLFMTTQYSSFIWERVSLMQQFQFPWRFMAVASFASAVLALHFLNLFKKDQLVFLFVIAVLAVSFPLISVKSYSSKSNNYYLDYPGTGAYHGEATTVWTAGDAYSYPDSPIQIIQGKGEIIAYERKTQEHKFTTKSEQEIHVRDNTTFYPGWIVLVDHGEVNIQFQDPNSRGLITFSVPPGQHEVEVRLTETTTRKISNLISLVSFISILFVLIFAGNFEKLIKIK